MRIIDKDLEFWESEIHTCQWSLQRCYPSCEPYWQERKAQAEKVLEEMRKYETILRKAP